MTQKKRALVVCPGRGTYNKEELGYLNRYHHDKPELIATIDNYRQTKAQPAISSLDAAQRYFFNQHGRGENASALIYGCAIADFHSIDRDKYDVCAVTGNSMGWYIAMAAAQALEPPQAIEVINTMGSMMTDKIIGGQLIYPAINALWQQDPSLRQSIFDAVKEINGRQNHQLHLSIDLGGYIVLGGDDNGLTAFESQMPRLDDRYPMRLFNHGAFHTPLLKAISLQAMAELPQQLFQAPKLPLIDGCGKIWQPYSGELDELYRYTLSTQVDQPYYFTTAIEVALKEFAPDAIIILGPGATLGSSVAQTLIKLNWQGISCKSDFIARQKTEPFVLAMGMPEQRQLVTIDN